MQQQDREGRRATFDRVALLYDQVRPGYPDALFDDIAALSSSGPGGRVLEIGCGTGKASVPLARRGYRVICVELGANLAAVARRNLAPYPGCEVHVSAFEDWLGPPEAFDLAVAAQAFHWLNPAQALPKIAAALKPGAIIALVRNAMVQAEDSEPGGRPDFATAVQEVYHRWAPPMARNWTPPPRANELRHEEAEHLAASGLFGPVALRHYPWRAAYSTHEYTALLETASDHLVLDEATRRSLLDGIAELIDDRFGGQIVRSYVACLYMAHKQDGPPG
jgi:SAM-dependent methyltransferase